MGMFDTLRLEVPIPGEPKPAVKDYQTKDLECACDIYTIRADGTLWRDKRDPWGGQSEVHEMQVPFHGVLRFYTLEDIEDTGEVGLRDHFWFEYEAKFTDGKLQGIDVIDIHR